MSGWGIATEDACHIGQRDSALGACRSIDDIAQAMFETRPIFILGDAQFNVTIRSNGNDLRYFPFGAFIRIDDRI